MKKVLFFILTALIGLGSLQLSAQQIVEIGTGSTTTNSYLPLYSFYNNTLSEQIYTANEIGMPGTITSIAFYNAGTTKTPDLKIYMIRRSDASFLCLEYLCYILKFYHLQLFPLPEKIVPKH